MKLAIMPILASEALLCGNKKYPGTNLLPPVKIESPHLINLNILLSELTGICLQDWDFMLFIGSN